MAVWRAPLHFPPAADGIGDCALPCLPGWSVTLRNIICQSKPFTATGAIAHKMTSDPASADPLPPLTIFVSYARDDLARARPVIDALTAEGLKVWWDGLLAGGDAYAHTTETALETADAVVVLWSARSVQSHWVRDEATRGRDRGRMVPVSLDGTMPPLGFRQIQYIDLSRWKGRREAAEFGELRRAIEATARTPRSQLSFAALTAGPQGVSRRRALALGGGLAAVIGGGALAWKSGLFGTAAQANSVAVLPFRNIGNNPEEAYFSDGLAEELRATLSRNQTLEVAAQTSSSSFREGNADSRTIASRLDVAYILDGSVRRAGDRLRITARLIEGQSGFERWTETFDRVAADIFALQDEIATAVADALAVNVAAGAAKGRIGGTRNKDALDAYLKGQELYKLGRDEQTDREALTRFDAALKLDPQYGAAHAARARALTVIANNYAKGDSLSALYDQAVAAAQAAVASSPELAEAHSALGFALFNGRLDAAAARAPYGKSFELGFGNADILSAFANFAGRTGNFADARKAIARAQRLDPLNAVVFRNAGVIEYSAREYSACQAPLRSALTINPDLAGVHLLLGDVHLIARRAAEARTHYLQEANALSRQRGLAIADLRLGNRAAAEAGLAKMIADYGDNSLYQQAQVQAQWGNAGAALAALESALSAGDSGLVQSRNDPLLDPLRREPRFAAILRQLGFDVPGSPAGK